MDDKKMMALLNTGSAYKHFDHKHQMFTFALF